MNEDSTTEEKATDGGTGPPVKHSLPLPENLDRCVGFICWSSDGSCLKTKAERISIRGRGR